MSMNPSDAPLAPRREHSTDPTLDAPSFVDLSIYDNSYYYPGRGIAVRTLWHYCSVIFFEGGWFPFNNAKVWLLRRFGARIGRGVTIKPNVRIKYPWRLAIGNHCWIGEDVWIDSLVDVEIGDNVCISQQVYLCTGSHDHRRRAFDLITRPIRIGNGAWLGARCTIFQGVIIGANSLVAGGSVVTKHVAAKAIVAGNPAIEVARREPPFS